jgi:predicted phage gp36 major capsid-like protein
LSLEPRDVRVQEYERKRFLERIERDGATVGQRVPERVTVDGDPFELRSFVTDVTTAERVTPEQRETVDEARVQLRRERNERVERIETGDLTVEEAEELVDSVVGIDRALNALERLEDADVEAEAERAERAGKKRWFSFLREALGHEDGSDGRTGPPEPE